MRIHEVLNEMRFGGSVPGVSTIDRSAPWVQAGIEKAAERSKKFKELATAKEKFEFLYKETKGFTNIKTIRVRFEIKGIPFPFKKYDHDTGDVFLRDPRKGQGQEIPLHKINIDQFEFDKRELSPSTSTKIYIFKTDADTEKTSEINPNYKKPVGRKVSPKIDPDSIKKSSDPFNLDIVKRANNLFGL